MSELAMLNDQDTRMKYLERTDRSVFQLRAQSALLGIPALRAAWSMASVDYVRPEATDISGHGNHLQSAAALGGVTFGYDNSATPRIRAPIAVFGGGVNQYLLRADGGAGNWADITGTETQIIAAERGLAIGGWFWWPALPGAVEHLMGKVDGVTPQYRLYLTAADTISWQVWPGPVAATSAATINVGWNHCFGIYDQPSQTLFAGLNGVVTAGGIGAAPAAIVDTALAFVIGADSIGGSRFTGSASMCFLSACSVPQDAIRGLRQEQRNVFGV